MRKEVDPELLILASLAGGPRHGYGIMQDVRRLTGVHLGPGTLYTAIPRLERQGLIEAMTATDRRRPYRITQRGAEVLRERLEAMRTLSTAGLARLGVPA
ncbi:MAG TPA: helix-turn-helix transcriptional regulator [Candidatus Dormibacteraeota bacterium]|nr:helix-turn-helix transcriptional regulator [Candidatus Dormibacteraeota bacterium]